MFKKLLNLFKRKKKEEKKPQITFLLRDTLEKNKPKVKTLIDKYVDNALKLAASSGMTIDEASRALATASQIPLPPEQLSVEGEPTYVNDPGFPDAVIEAPQRSLQYSKHGMDNLRRIKELEKSFEEEEQEEKPKLSNGKRRRIIRRKRRDS